MNTRPDMQHFFGEQEEKSFQNFRTFTVMPDPDRWIDWNQKLIQYRTFTSTGKVS